MDRLPWTRWHWLVVVALGITWILDGLEVTIVGSIAAVLTRPQTLDLSATQVGLAGTLYILGAVTGAISFGYLTDRLGRKRLFMWTLVLYLLATVATAFSWNAASFFVFRFLTGMGIGGEYSAVNSAVDELIPARVRGWADLAINGSWWVGTAAGAALTILLLNPNFLSVDVGWRLSFGLGATLGVAVLLVRRVLPESPRWLIIHNRVREAERVVGQIEERVMRDAGVRSLPPPKRTIELRPREHTPVREILRTMFKDHLRRTIVGLSLMSGQAFIYNATVFTFGLVLTRFLGAADQNVGYYMLPFALGNFLGPLTLGRLFDAIGRKVMITSTYVVSGLLLVGLGWLFDQRILVTSALSFTIGLSIVFFFASAGASSAYLTVSEIFPLEIRAIAIAFFYAFGTGLSGAIGPLLFGALVDTGNRFDVFIGYCIGAAVMVAAGIVEALLGVPAERRSLEDVARPLSAQERASIEDRAA
jgi:MFS family permease